MKRQHFVVTIGFLVTFVLLAGCGGSDNVIPGPNLPNPVDIFLPKKLPELDINLGLTPEARETIQRTNDTVRRINDTLAKGINLGPETLGTINNITVQIEQFNKSGVLGEDGLLLADKLVNMLDQGLKVGLDEATLEMGESFASVINDQPGKWQHSLEILIEALNVVGTDLSDKIAGDLGKLETQVSHDIGGIIQRSGEQARCTVDYSGQQINDSVASAGGRFVGGLLPILKPLYDKNHTVAKIPGVCEIAPYDMALEWKDDGTLAPRADAQLIQISGFNFSNENRPVIAILPEDEGIAFDIPLTATRETSYRMTVNLQGKNFSQVTPGSKLVIKWSDAVPDLTFRKSILVESPNYAVANFSASTTQGEAPLNVKFFNSSSGEPTTYFWNFGDGSTASTRNPEHPYNAIGVYTVTLSVDNSFNKPDSLAMRNFITVSAPPPPVANFDVQPAGGQGPLEVKFADLSKGGPVSWVWNFGDGQTSDAPSPSHLYEVDGSYTASLTVRNAYDGMDVHTTTIIVYPTLTPVPTQTPVPTPTSTPLPTPTPEFTTYRIVVKTSCESNSGTDGDFLIRLIGESNTAEQDLDKPDYEDQATCGKDTYDFSLPTLGTIQYVEVEIDSDDDWKSDWIIVTNTATGAEYSFDCNAWLGDDADGWRVRIPDGGYCAYY